MALKVVYFLVVKLNTTRVDPVPPALSPTTWYKELPITSVESSNISPFTLAEEIILPF
jgi:hypothetical protein